MRAGFALLLAALVAGADDAARRAFRAGDFEAASREYAALLAKRPGSAELRYNLGSSLLALGRFEEARPHLEAAARAAGAGWIHPHAYYNLGNADLFPVFRGEAEPERRERLTRAITAYKRSLLLDPDDADAKWNLELARRLLDQEPRSPSPNPRPSAGGGGGSDDRDRGRRDPRPRPAAAGGEGPTMTPAEAERLLASAEMREAGLQKEKLRKPQPRSPTAHD